MVHIIKTIHYTYVMRSDPVSIQVSSSVKHKPMHSYSNEGAYDGFFSLELS